MIEKKSYKVLTIGTVIAATLGIHYGWIIEPFFGHVHWIHVMHGRFCYIPIVIAASWFGIRGGLYTAALISFLVLPYIFGGNLDNSDFAGEMIELIFYFAFGLLTGALVDRELLARRKHQDAQLHLERSQKFSLVGKIAAGVAHEIKNPLASIKGALEIIFDNKTSHEDKEEFRGIMVSEIKRIDNTVKDFLNFARPREARFEKLNLSHTLNDCLKQIEVQTLKNKIKISSDIQENVFITGDKEKIHQVALNLLLNAMDASPMGSEIKVTMSNNESRKVLITIQDHGKGIEREVIDQIFDPFYTTKTTGTGLGLSIVRSIIDHHNGTISVESKVEEGTLVTVIIPSYRELS